jgi:hypothetical protein
MNKGMSKENLNLKNTNKDTNNDRLGGCIAHT